VDEQHVRVAAPSGVERLAGALRHHAHLDAGLRLEQRQEVLEQAGGLAIDGKEPVLEKMPSSLHERTGLILGSKKLVEEYLSS
jgi:hypothetical protein